MNCIPNVCVFDSNNEQVLPNINILNADSFEIDFDFDTTDDEFYCQNFYCIINYQTEYGDPTTISSNLMTLVEQATIAKNEAVSAKEDVFLIVVK